MEDKTEHTNKQKRRVWIADTEANSLNPDTVHCAVFMNYHTWEIKKFVQKECYTDLPKFMKEEVDLLVGHNFYGFDLPKVFHPLLKVPFPYSKTMDTLILSRLAEPDRKGGHGLEVWGERVGVKKPVQEQWDTFTPEMLHRCTEDVKINHRVFEILLRDLKGYSKQSIKLEHQVQKILFDMERFGFYLDEEKAQRLYFDLKIKVDEMQEQLQKDFPPVTIPYNKQKEVVSPRYKKVKVKQFDDSGEPLKEVNPDTGRMRQVYKEDQELSPVGLSIFEKPGKNEEYDSKGRIKTYITELKPYVKWTDVVGDFCPFKWQPFNPGSTTQVVERLEEARWQPIEYNKPTENMLAKNIFVGSPKVNETNLETIPEDAPQSAKNIASYLLCSSRMSTIDQWLEAVDKDSRVHGRINSLGARTHRCSHNCVPMFSKALTRNGWKFYEELKVGEDILAYDPIRRVKCWTPLRAKNKFTNAAIGSLGQKSERKRFYCTDNHRWLVRKRDCKLDKPFHFKEAHEIRRNDSILINAPFENDVTECDFTLIHKKYGHDWVSEICKMSDVELNAIMQGFLLADGYFRPGRFWSFSQAEGVLFEAFLTCFYLLPGKRVSAAQKNRLKGPKHRYGYNVSLTTNSYMRSKDIRWKFEYYGDVWCPTTDLGTWVMKQDDFITITGNSPNTANIPSVDKPYGDVCRDCWTVPTDEDMKRGKFEHIYKSREPRTIVGCDASGIQLRVLGHYMNDPDYIKALVSGDIHTVNMFAAGIDPGEAHFDPEVFKGTEDQALKQKLGKTEGVEWEGRSVAKTFIYAWLLGAGDAKVQQITKQKGKELKQRFLDNLPALKRLKEVEVKKAVTNGYYTALDGRRIGIPSNHLALSAYLQGGEAIIMKLALMLLVQRGRKRNLPMFPVAYVHDEFQIDSQESCAEETGELAKQCIIDAGKILKMNCPLDAEYRIGKSWKDTH